LRKPSTEALIRGTERPAFGGLTAETPFTAAIARNGVHAESGVRLTDALFPILLLPLPLLVAVLLFCLDREEIA